MKSSAPLTTFPAMLAPLAADWRRLELLVLVQREELVGEAALVEHVGETQKGRFRPSTSPSANGAIKSSKQRRGSGFLIVSCLRRVLFVHGRTSVRIAWRKGRKNQLFGTRINCASREEVLELSSRPGILLDRAFAGFLRFAIDFVGPGSNGHIIGLVAECCASKLGEYQSGNFRQWT
eukprot:6212784-Pleurochrysis_carterae.AAC.2